MSSLSTQLVEALSRPCQGLVKALSRPCQGWFVEACQTGTPRATPQWSIGVHRPDRRSFDSRVGVAAGREKRGRGSHRLCKIRIFWDRRMPREPNVKARSRQDRFLRLAKKVDEGRPQAAKQPSSSTPTPTSSSPISTPLCDQTNNLTKVNPSDRGEQE